MFGIQFAADWLCRSGQPKRWYARCVRHGSRRMASRRRSCSGRLDLDALEDRCLPSFLPPVEWQAAFHAVAVVTADLRGNGVLDLIETNDNGGQNGTVTVLLGIGNGTFHAPVSYRVGGGPPPPTPAPPTLAWIFPPLP